ncbi:MAG: methionine adenosyltransferase [Chloroflexota bacterium]
MTNSFSSSLRYLFTSESVTEGHPDKLCDRISDAVLDAIIKDDPEARVACEVAVTVGLVMVMGEITTRTYVDVNRVVREVVRDVGYTKTEYGFEANTCGVVNMIHGQSPDIARAVDKAAEVRAKKGVVDVLDRTGAGDQGMMVGFACNETVQLMPMPIYYAHRLCQRIAEVRKKGILPYLRPDGKSQVTVEYERGVPKRIDCVILAAQHDPDVTQEAIQRDLIKHVVDEVLPKKLVDSKTRFMVNTSGRFEVGGPVGDTGFTGRKILVDTYGGACRHGGGAFSGKDPTKVDRSAAYYARYVAKNVVAAGLAERLELQVAYAIGRAQPLSLSIETFGTGKVPDELIMKLIEKHFDFRPEAIIRSLDLRRPIYLPVAAYGHFGRDDVRLPWEKTDKARILSKEARLLQ